MTPAQVRWCVQKKKGRLHRSASTVLSSTGCVAFMFMHACVDFGGVFSLSLFFFGAPPQSCSRLIILFFLFLPSSSRPLRSLPSGVSARTHERAFCVRACLPACLHDATFASSRKGGDGGMGWKKEALLSARMCGERDRIHLSIHLVEVVCDDAVCFSCCACLVCLACLFFSLFSGSRAGRPLSKTRGGSKKRSAMIDSK